MPVSWDILTTLFCVRRRIHACHVRRRIHDTIGEEEDTWDILRGHNAPEP